MSEKHTEIHLADRRELTVVGVKEILSFDESAATLVTEDGELEVEGVGVRILELDSSGGEIQITGRISAIYFSEDSAEKRKGLFGKLFG